jgi:hypothetical protein
MKLSGYFVCSSLVLFSGFSQSSLCAEDTVVTKLTEGTFEFNFVRAILSDVKQSPSMADKLFMDAVFARPYLAHRIVVPLILDFEVQQKITPGIFAWGFCEKVAVKYPILGMDIYLAFLEYYSKNAKSQNAGQLVKRFESTFDVIVAEYVKIDANDEAGRLLPFIDTCVNYIPKRALLAKGAFLEKN